VFTLCNRGIFIIIETDLKGLLKKRAGLYKSATVSLIETSIGSLALLSRIISHMADRPP